MPIKNNRPKRKQLLEQIGRIMDEGANAIDKVQTAHRLDQFVGANGGANAEFAPSREVRTGRIDFVRIGTRFGRLVEWTSLFVQIGFLASGGGALGMDWRGWLGDERCGSTDLG